MHNLGARKDMNSHNLGSSLRVVQTAEHEKRFCSVDSNLKEVNAMATMNSKDNSTFCRLFSRKLPLFSA